MVRDRQRQRVGDGLFVPALGFQPLDRAPDVHARHRGADQVLGDRAHRVGGLVGIADQHVDHRQIGLDRGLHPAVADDDHQPVILRTDARRLDDADSLDGGEQLFIHRRRHRRRAGIVRIGLERYGDRRCEVRPWLAPVGWGFILPVLREDPSRAAHPGPAGQGRAQREARGRTLAAADGDAAAVSSLWSSLHPILSHPDSARRAAAVVRSAAHGRCVSRDRACARIAPPPSSADP